MAEHITTSTPSPTDEGRDALLTPDFLRKLEQLTLVLRRTFAGRMSGARRSPRRGQSVEFADFRNYAQGDDLRRVDWNVYARLEKLFLKLFLEEEDLHVHLLIDTSRSMHFGTPRKLLAAQRLCAALGYITLCSFDRLTVAALTDRVSMRLRELYGRGSTHTLFTWLRGLRAEGPTDLAAALRAYALQMRTPGLVMVVSDFLAPGVEEGVRALVGRKSAVTLLQVLSPEEVQPVVIGDVRLLDAETGAVREITVTPGLLRRYQHRLAEHRQLLEGLGVRYGVNYVHTTTAEPFEDLVMRYLKERRVVR